MATVQNVRERLQQNIDDTFAGAYTFEDVGARVRERNLDTQMERFTDYDIGYVVLSLYPEYSDSIGLYADPYAYVDPDLKATLEGIRAKNTKENLEEMKEILQQKVQERTESQETVESQQLSTYRRLNKEYGDQVAIGSIWIFFILFLGLCIFVGYKFLRLAIKAYKKLDKALDIPEEKEKTDFKNK